MKNKLSKTSKRFFSVLTTVVMILGIAPFSIFSSAVSDDYSGSIGELAWSLNLQTGELAISGTGEIQSYLNSSSVPWYDYRENIKTVSIKDGVTAIGDYSFYDCDNLTGLNLSDSVKKIGKYSFYDCDGLTSLNIVSGVTSIGEGAFYNCDGLTEVMIGKNVTSIGDSAFYYCKSLKTIEVDGENKFYSSDDNGVLFNKNKTSLIQYPIGAELTNYNIPDSVTSIEDSAFFSSKNLTSVTFTGNVKKIGDYAFRDCISLKMVAIPQGTEIIGYSAFKNCNKLKDISIADSVSSIGYNAFYFTEYYNKDDNWIDGVLYIDNCLIKASTDLTGSFSVKPQTKTIADYAMSGCENVTSVSMPNDVVSIGYEAFYGCSSMTEINISDSVKVIGNEAFYNCGSLKNIKIPDSVTTIGSFLFYNCTDLETAEIGNKVTTIGKSAFEGCNSMTSITIPNSILSVEDNAFNDCENLSVVNYYGTSDEWNQISISSIGNGITTAEINHYFSAEQLVVTPTETVYNGSQQSVDISTPDGVGDVTVYYEGVAPTVYAKTTNPPTEAGMYAILIDATKGSEYNAVNNMFVCNYVIAKAEYPHSAPSNLKAKYGDKLFDVLLPDTDSGYFKWDSSLYDENTTVGNVGTNSFKAVYTPPSPQNYKTEQTDLKINVIQSEPVFSVPKNLTGFLGKTLSDVVLPNDENGSFRWEIKSPENVKFDKCGEFTFNVSYVPKNSNYMSISSIKVTVNVICEHSKQYSVIVKEPTYTETGITEYYCSLCGELVSTTEMEKIPSIVSSVSVDENLSLKYKSDVKLVPDISYVGLDNYSVSYSSSDARIVTVDAEGNIHAAKRGNAVITCTVTDESGNVQKALCNVSVNYSFGQWLIKILLFGWIWY